jgi:diguanylate cyclase (GGDEF)-like protein
MGVPEIGEDRDLALEERHALLAENRELRATLRDLTQAAGRNDALLRKTGERELELLRAGSLAELFGLLVRGLRESYQLDAVALLLHDPRHEIRHLLVEDGADPELIASIRFADFLVRVAPQFTALERPWLGPWNATEHEPLFGQAHFGSVALIPLPRREQLDGVLGFGSADPSRFRPDLASDFLAHLGVIAAICIENAVNRSRLVRAGLTDFLTGWNNRRYLQTRLAEELARAERQNSSVACMMIDIDHFKRVNDLHGHLAGDAVLREVAQRIDAELRQSDARARFGGDEFAVVLPGVRLAGGQQLATRILEAVTQRPVPLGAHGAETITLSIGLASLEPPAGTRDYKALCEQLVAEADAALYRAKSAGRNRVVTADPLR